MNSERRHELQQNDLAIWLNKVNKSVEPYSKPAAIVLGVLVVGALILGFWRSEQMAERSDATLQLIQASAGQDAEVLMAVSNTYPDTEAGEWARLYQGQLLLSQGMQQLFSDRETAEGLLKDAKQALEAAIDSSRETLLLSRGQYGIAQAAEALGNLDEAIEAYKKVVEINESEAMVKLAQERIDTLSKPDSQAFVSWFGEQDFSPAADPSLPPTLPGMDNLPGLPDLSFPTLDSDSEGESAPRDLEGGIELPQEGVDAAGQETPAEESAAPAEGEPEAAGDSEDAPASEPESTEPEASAPESAEPSAADDGAADADQPASDEESSQS